jgi:hypothetical protein
LENFREKQKEDGFRGLLGFGNELKHGSASSWQGVGTGGGKHQCRRLAAVVVVTCICAGSEYQVDR